LVVSSKSSRLQNGARPRWSRRWTDPGGGRNRDRSVFPPAPFPHQFEGFATQSAFIYEDSSATFFVQPIQRSEVGSGGGSLGDLEFTSGIRHTHGVTPDDVGSVFPLALERASITIGLPGAVDTGNLVDTLAASPFVSGSGSPSKKFRFFTHYHSRAREFLSALFDGCLDGLLGRLELQGIGAASFFENRYEPVPSHVASPHPRNGVDFSSDGAYSVYNWELFFHIPLLVADRLRQEQRFEEAQRWFHYVFNPTQCDGDNAPQCYWKVRPFFEYDLSDPESQPVQDLMVTLSEGTRLWPNRWRRGGTIPLIPTPSLGFERSRTKRRLS
jgi:hypothetical protein